MPKVAFLVPASPNAGFYSEIAAINLVIKTLPWQRWEPILCVTMGSRMPSANEEDSFDRWRSYVREVNFTYVAESQWLWYGNWAQVDSVLQLAPRDADVYVTIDADILPVAGLEGILDEVYERKSIAGIMAHCIPPLFNGVQDWDDLSRKINAKSLDCSFAYSLVDSNEPDGRRKSPIYFNGGVIFYHHNCFDEFVRPYSAMCTKLKEHLGIWADFSGQIAMPFVLADNHLPAYTLPIRYNYPNDDAAILLHPGELENVVIFHYLRTEIFDRRRIFANADEYNIFLGQKLTGANLAFQKAVQRCLGVAYPFR
jgi:hypothetical protein